MTDPEPIACSLRGSDLRRRHDLIAAVGAAALTGHEQDGSRHALHFRADPATRRQLEQIVVAEAACCSFLDLDLSERDGELLLTIAAPAASREVADALAAGFIGQRGRG